jgi:hypothetical protein
LVQNNAFNQYCIDCKKNVSDTCSLSFGIFLCSICAHQHRVQLGKDISNVKSIMGENWNPFELQYFLDGIGGNQPFFEYMKKYHLEHAAIYHKYTAYPTRYYGQKLDCSITGRVFDMHEPLDDWRDDVMEVGKTFEKGVQKVGGALEGAWNKSGIEGKMKGWFNKVVKKKDTGSETTQT